MRSNCRISVVSQICSLYQDGMNMANLRYCEIGNFRELGEPLFDRGFGRLIWRLQKLATFANEDSAVKGRPSQRRCLKSPGSKCELVANL
jgi:hypothetical protein